MLAHNWVVETVDGGPAGDGDFYRCVRCGASGGSTETYRFPPNWPKPSNSDRTEDRMIRIIPIPPEEARPFLPGPATPLSNDCEIASEQIRMFVWGLAYGQGRMTHEREVASFISWKLTQDHSVTNFMPLVDVLMGWNRPQTPAFLEEVKEMAKMMGFPVAKWE